MPSGVCARVWPSAEYTALGESRYSSEGERVSVPRSAAMGMVGHKTESIYRRYATSMRAYCAKPR